MSFRVRDLMITVLQPAEDCPGSSEGCPGTSEGCPGTSTDPCGSCTGESCTSCTGETCTTCTGDTKGLGVGCFGSTGGDPAVLLNTEDLAALQSLLGNAATRIIGRSAVRRTPRVTTITQAEYLEKKLVDALAEVRLRKEQLNKAKPVSPRAPARPFSPPTRSRKKQ